MDRLDMKDALAQMVKPGDKLILRTGLTRHTVEALSPIRHGICRAKDGEEFRIVRVEDILRIAAQSS